MGGSDELIEVDSSDGFSWGSVANKMMRMMLQMRCGGLWHEQRGKVKKHQGQKNVVDADDCLGGEWRVYVILT